MFKRIISLGIRCAGLLIMMAVLGTLWLTLSFLCPVNKENAQKSYEILHKEGFYPNALDLEAEYDVNENFHSFLPAILDNHTDAIMLYTAMYCDITNPLEAAMEMHSDYLNDSYERYWHGYVGILRPLLMLLDYGKVRVLNGGIQFLLTVILGRLVWRKTRKAGYCLMLLSSYLLLLPIAVAMGLQFTWVFYVAYGTSLLLVGKREYFSIEGRYLYIFLIAGGLTSFFDLLTYPLFTWAFPCVWFLAVAQEDSSSLRRVKQVISSGICWVIGYSGMWVLKWIISGIILGQNVSAAAMQQVAVRAGAETFTVNERLQSIYLNWKHYGYLPFVLILCVWFYYFLHTVFRYGIGKSTKMPALLLIVFSGFVWYFVLADHTFTHHFFSYRIYNGCILAFFALVLECRYSAKQEMRLKERGRLLLGCIIIAAASVGLALTAREELLAMNGECDFREIEIKSGQNCTADFIPTFSQVKSIGFGMRNIGATGDCVISVYRDEKKLYEEHIALSNYGENVYYSFPVKWNLKHGRTYVLEMCIDSKDGKTYILVTDNGALPLLEYSNLSIDEIPVQGQFLSGIVYSCLPIDKKELVFYMITWMGVLGIAAVTAYSTYLNAGKKRVTFSE